MSGKVQPRGTGAPFRGCLPQDGVSNVDRAQKRELVTKLNEQWKESGVLVVAHYKGMTVAQMTDFRKRVKEAGGVVKVTKNRLAKLAL